MNTRFYFAVLTICGMTAVASAFTPAPVYKAPPKPKVTPIVAAMQGTWEVERAIILGRRMRPGLAVRRSTFIRIQNNSWTYIQAINGVEQETEKLDLALDTRQHPATLDLKVQNNAVGNAQVVLKGIVKVEGDRLTFCYVSGYNQGAERPRHFDGNGQVVLINGAVVNPMTMTLKKVK